MAAFRLYKLTSDGKIAVGEWLEAEDLAAAKRMALDMCRGQPFRCELWKGAERLLAFTCDGRDREGGACG